MCSCLLLLLMMCGRGVALSFRSLLYCQWLSSQLCGIVRLSSLVCRVSVVERRRWQLLHDGRIPDLRPPRNLGKFPSFWARRRSGPSHLPFLLRR